MAILPENIVLAVLGAGLMGMFAIGTPTIVTALLERDVSPKRYLTFLGWDTAVFALGQIAGSAVAGRVIDSVGLAVGTAGAGLLLLLPQAS